MNNNTIISEELKDGNIEMGEFFAKTLNDMIRSDGIPNPKAEALDIMSGSWIKQANKKNKTPEENNNLNKTFTTAIKTLAQSYLLYIAKEVKNTTGKLDYSQFEAYMFKSRFRNQQNGEIKKKIQTAFEKIDQRGSESPADGIIDKEDFSRYLYALAMTVQGGVDNLGFNIPGFIDPMEYAVDDILIFEQGRNMFSIKLQIADNMLNKDNSEG